MAKMSAYDRDQRARANRVAKGKTKLVKASELQPGMICRDHGMRFSHNEMQICSGFERNVICFTDGTGYVSGLDSMVEVTA